MCAGLMPAKKGGKKKRSTAQGSGDQGSAASGGENQGSAAESEGVNQVSIAPNAEADTTTLGVVPEEEEVDSVEEVDSAENGDQDSTVNDRGFYDDQGTWRPLKNDSSTIYNTILSMLNTQDRILKRLEDIERKVLDETDDSDYSRITQIEYSVQVLGQNMEYALQSINNLRANLPCDALPLLHNEKGPWGRYNGCNFQKTGYMIRDLLMLQQQFKHVQKQLAKLPGENGPISYYPPLTGTWNAFFLDDMTAMDPKVYTLHKDERTGQMVDPKVAMMSTLYGIDKAIRAYVGMKEFTPRNPNAQRRRTTAQDFDPSPEFLNKIESKHNAWGHDAALQQVRNDIEQLRAKMQGSGGVQQSGGSKEKQKSKGGEDAFADLHSRVDEIEKYFEKFKELFSSEPGKAADWIIKNVKALTDRIQELETQLTRIDIDHNVKLTSLKAELSKVQAFLEMTPDGSVRQIGKTSFIDLINTIIKARMQKMIDDGNLILDKNSNIVWNEKEEGNEHDSDEEEGVDSNDDKEDKAAEGEHDAGAYNLNEDKAGEEDMPSSEMSQLATEVEEEAEEKAQSNNIFLKTSLKRDEVQEFIKKQFDSAEKFERDIQTGRNNIKEMLREMNDRQITDSIWPDLMHKETEAFELLKRIEIRADEVSKKLEQGAAGNSVSTETSKELQKLLKDIQDCYDKISKLQFDVFEYENTVRSLKREHEQRLQRQREKARQ